MAKRLFLIFSFLFLIFLIPSVSAIDISTCQTLTAGNSYKLTSNVTSSGTCFTIGGNSVTLDCDGYWINYDSGGAGYGIIANNRDYLTIQNCSLYEITTQRSGYGMYIYGGSDWFRSYNNTIHIKGTSAYPMYLNNAKHAYINGTNTNSIAPPSIYLYNSLNNTINNSDLSSTRRMCLWVYGTLTTQYENFVENSNCEGKPILYEYNNNTAMTDWNASEFGQVLWTASNNWECDNCTFTDSGLFFGYVTNALINNSVLNVTDATALNMYGINTNNEIYNTQINVKGSQIGSYGVYMYNGANSNTFENVTMTITSPSSYGLYLNAVTSNTFNNLSITSTGTGTTIGTYFINANNNEFDLFEFSSTGTAYGIYTSSTASTGNIFNKLFMTLLGTSSSNRGLYCYSGNCGFELWNGTITINAGSGRAFYWGTSTSGLIELTNVTIDDNKLYMAVTSTAELRKKWYTQIYTEDGGTDIPLSNALIKVYNVYSNLVYSGLSDANGLSPLLIVEEYRYYSGTEQTYTPHFIIASKTPDYTTAYINHNYQENNITLDLILEPYIEDYPLPQYEDPTPANNAILPTNSYVVNVSVKDYSWENKTLNYTWIYNYSGFILQDIDKFVDNNLLTNWVDVLHNYNYLKIDMQESVTSRNAYIYTNTDFDSSICGGKIYGSDSPESDFNLIGYTPDFGYGNGQSWWTIPLNGTSYRYYYYNIYIFYDDGSGTCDNTNSYPLVQGAFEFKLDSLSGVGEVDTCNITLTNITDTYNFTMQKTIITQDYVYCNYTIENQDNGWNAFLVSANDTEGNMGISLTRNIQIDTSGATITFVTPTPTNNSYLFEQDYIEVKVDADEDINNVILEWEKVGESIDNFSMSGSGEVWELNRTMLGTGQYKFRVFGDNIDSITSVSEDRYVTLDVEALPPVITFIYPTPKNNKMITNSTSIINVSSDETMSWVVLEFDGDNFTMVGSVYNWNYTINNLDYGVYKYRVYGNSTSSGIWGVTEERRLAVNSGDQSSIFGYILLFILGVFILLGFIAIKSKNFVISIASILFGILFLIFGFQLMMLIPEVMGLMDLYEHIGVGYEIILWGFYIIIFVAIIVMFVLTIKYWKLKKEKDKQERGEYYDE